MNGPESKYCLGERGRGGIYVEEREGGGGVWEEDQRWGDLSMLGTKAHKLSSFH